MKKYLKMFITGGLGNQLFQIAAALQYANGRRIQLDVETANPRRNSQGHAELLTLRMPDNFEIDSKNRGAFAAKIFGFNLRSGYFPKAYEKKTLFLGLRNILSSLFFSIQFGKPFIVKVANNLGNDPDISAEEKNEILIGYFQTHLVATEILKISDSLFFNVGESEYLRFKELASEDLPLLVHVRLGDYLTENQFGVLSNSYYQSSIMELWESGDFKAIWLFSDGPVEAILRVPEKLRDLTRVIQSEHMESAETLRIMTLCKGFVIANSTFSWWAAYLREDRNSKVVAPEPWFVDLPEPKLLIPREWKRFKGFDKA